MPMTNIYKNLEAARLRVMYAANSCHLEMEDNALNGENNVAQACRLAEHLNGYLYIMKKIMEEEASEEDANWR